MSPYHNFDLLQETVDIDGHLVRHADDAVEEIAQCQVENEDSDRSGHLLKPDGDDDDGDDDGDSDGDDDGDDDPLEKPNRNKNGRKTWLL